MQQDTPKEDLHQRITNQIVAAIEAGAGDYQMPWNQKLCTGPAIGLPHNPVGHYAYHGINTVALWASQQHCAYATAEWATFRQWQAAGAQVRKGEKGTLTVFFKASGSGQQSTANDEQEPRRHFIAKAAYVFNAAQVDGFTPSAPHELTNIERMLPPKHSSMPARQAFITIAVTPATFQAKMKSTCRPMVHSRMHRAITA